MIAGLQVGEQGCGHRGKPRWRQHRAVATLKLGDSVLQSKGRRCATPSIGDGLRARLDGLNRRIKYSRCVINWWVDDAEIGLRVTACRYDQRILLFLHPVLLVARFGYRPPFKGKITVQVKCVRVCASGPGG